MNDWHLVRWGFHRQSDGSFIAEPERTIARGCLEAMQAAGRLCGYTGPQLDSTRMQRGLVDEWYAGSGVHYRIEQRPCTFRYVPERREAEKRGEFDHEIHADEDRWSASVESSERAETYARESRALRGSW